MSSQTQNSAEVEHLRNTLREIAVLAAMFPPQHPQVQDLTRLLLGALDPRTDRMTRIRVMTCRDPLSGPLDQDEWNEIQQRFAIRGFRIVGRGCAWVPGLGIDVPWFEVIGVLSGREDWTSLVRAETMHVGFDVIPEEG